MTRANFIFEIESHDGTTTSARVRGDKRASACDFVV